MGVHAGQGPIGSASGKTVAVTGQAPVIDRGTSALQHGPQPHSTAACKMLPRTSCRLRSWRGTAFDSSSRTRRDTAVGELRNAAQSAKSPCRTLDPSKTPTLRSELARGLVGQKPDAVAYQLALWHRLKISRVLFTKLRSLIPRRTYDAESAIAAQIEPYARAYASRPPQENQVELLALIAGHLGVALPTHASAADLDQVCTEISERAVAALRRTNKEFKGNTVEDMVRFSMDGWFRGLGAKLRDLPEDEQEALVQELVESIRSMPGKQRRAMLKKLGTDQITTEIVRKAALNGTLGTAFVVAVEIAGFSAYTFATSALASIAGVVGLTLPFGVYTTLTSFMAFFANPFLMVPALAGFMFWQKKRGDRKLKDGLVASIVTALIVSEAALDSAVDPKPLLDELQWQQVKQEWREFTRRNWRKWNRDQRQGDAACEMFNMLTSIYRLPEQRRNAMLEEVRNLLGSLGR